MVALVMVVAFAVLSACSGVGNSGDGASGGSPQTGGDLVYVRASDSTSMDATSVFDNDSIWVFEQIYETLYEVAPNGKDLKPLLATSYDLSKDKRTYTFHLRKGVKFSTGQEMTSADVKFSLDQARAADEGWGFIDAAIKNVEAPDKYTVVVNTKYPWAPMLADLSMFNNGIVPKNYGGKSKEAFYRHPIGTGPFVWDHWDRGNELKLVKNPSYWDKGKPYVNSVTFKLVAEDNTRALQLQGGQAHINQFPPFSSVEELKASPNLNLDLFPSTRTDYIMLNENREPFDDVHVRRAISYAINRADMVQSILFGNGRPANSFMPPQVPYYDPDSRGLQYDLEKAKKELGKSSVPDGFETTFLSGSGDETDDAISQVVQQNLGAIGIDVKIEKLDPSTVQSSQQEMDYDISHSYWTMDIADPDELVSFAVLPEGGAHSFYTNYNNPQVIGWTEEAQRTFDPQARQELYSKIQAQAAEDAFMVFLYYSPYVYATSKDVHDFLVYPTGNFHMEDVWLSSQ
jgi:peptide/nickel transport system substrate-binding protein